MPFSGDLVFKMIIILTLTSVERLSVSFWLKKCLDLAHGNLLLILNHDSYMYILHSLFLTRHQKSQSNPRLTIFTEIYPLLHVYYYNDLF